MICVFSFPACNPATGRILPICSNRCGVVDIVIGRCSLEFFRNDPEFPAINQFLDTFVCNEPETYYNFPLQYIETMDPNDCSSIGWYINLCLSMFLVAPCVGSIYGNLEYSMGIAGNL